MRRFLFFLPLLALAWPACTDEQIVVIKADAGPGGDGSSSSSSGSVEQPPIGTQTDSGISGRRLGDKGCKTNEDCDSSLCFLALSEADNFCTKACTKSSEETDCPKPQLAGRCTRQLTCEAAPSE